MWQIILGIGIVFLLMEIFVPSMFFLNFALAAFVCALVSYFCQNIILLILLFCVLSFVFIYTLRPLFLNKNKKEEKTGMEEKYVGKTAKAAEQIDKNKGAISIYDERWQARTTDDTTIEIDEIVKITGYDSLIMKVKKID